MGIFVNHFKVIFGVPLESIPAEHQGVPEFIAHAVAFIDARGKNFPPKNSN